MNALTISPRDLILLLAVRQERSGRDVAKIYESVIGRRIGYGSLYTAFGSLVSRDLVSKRDDEDLDGLLRLFKITKAGEEILARLDSKNQVPQ